MDFRTASFPEPGDRFRLGSKIGSGLGGQVYEAFDNKCGKNVAIKVIHWNLDKDDEVNAERKVYAQYSQHCAIPEFYGIFCKKSRGDIHQIWIVMELCDGGSVKNYISSSLEVVQKVHEDHIAYILRELIKAIVHLHENEIIHRDIRADNVLLTDKGQVKLCDFGISCSLSNNPKLRIGSPSWLAPEVVLQRAGYDTRSDVWSLGITAIELGDGKAPFENIHPARTLFQIVRNPPPTLYRPCYWSQLYNDFIAECLEKSHDNRPQAQELLEHPFFEIVNGEEDRIRNEIITVLKRKRQFKDTKPDVMVKNSNLFVEGQKHPEKLLQEDLAALELITEDAILNEIHQRANLKQYYTFVGDILLSINPNENLNIYGIEFKKKYQFKARSDNAPHIYSIADKAYQDALHNEEPQHILLSGEAISGKTTNMKHILDHLLYLGQNNRVGEIIDKALEVIHVLGNAEMATNPNSTRHFLQTQLMFTKSGKICGSHFYLYLLEKLRVTDCDRNKANFHIFNYFYDALESDGNLHSYNLVGGRDYVYLKAHDEESFHRELSTQEISFKNKHLFKKFENNLSDLSFTKLHLNTIRNVISAILLLGELEFTENGIENAHMADSVANLLGMDVKEFKWCLLNYRVLNKDSTYQKKLTVEESIQARDVLAQTLYTRLTDWIVHIINDRLSATILGPQCVINIFDQFGVECLPKNSLEQLFVNVTNEQLQYFYNQRTFLWEMDESLKDEIPLLPLSYYDNKIAVDQIMVRPDGLLHMLDDAAKNRKESQLPDKIKRLKGPYIHLLNYREFIVSHYAGRITYDLSEMTRKNRDFMPPEMTETLRNSSNAIIKQIFTEPLNKTGNLILPPDPSRHNKGKAYWGMPFTNKREVKECEKYSQVRQMRTLIGIFRSTWLEILKRVGTSNCSVHFVKCIRPCLTDQPGGFQKELVQQQLRALAVVDTARARQQGYPIRISFKEFLKRYQFLAFDFNETVDVTKDNCRLLLIRLKLEGWIVGKTKVFLTYYNEEYLSRLYENQVKKIIKIQSMMRAFIVKRNFKYKLETMRQLPSTSKLKIEEKKMEVKDELSEDQAATIIQKQFRGKQVRKEYGTRACKDLKNEDTKILVQKMSNVWRKKSIYQVLLQYRAARFQDLIYFSQQVHIYNQSYLSEMHEQNEEIKCSKIDSKVKPENFLPEKPVTIHKLPFRFHYLRYCDNAYFCDPFGNVKHPSGAVKELLDERWDTPLRRNLTITGYSLQDKGVQTNSQDTKEGSGVIFDVPFVRDVGSKNSDFQRNREQKVHVYKAGKKVAPQPPKMERNVKFGADNHVNAIKELETIFKKGDTSHDNDEAPFNFQAMLRKTDIKRESLKRSNVVFNSSTSSTNVTSNRQKVYVNTQLVPGIVAVGEAVEL